MSAEQTLGQNHYDIKVGNKSLGNEAKFKFSVIKVTSQNNFHDEN